MFTTTIEPREEDAITLHVQHELPGTKMKLAMIVPRTPPEEWLDAPKTMDWFHVSSTTGEPLEAGSNKFYDYDADGLVSRVKRPMLEHLMVVMAKNVPWATVADLQDWPVEKLEKHFKEGLDRMDESETNFDVSKRKQRYMPGDLH